ncbi:hypothetical protein ACHAXS_007225 [Conticribra weissflogii]
MGGSENSTPSNNDKPTIQRDARGGKAIQQRGKGKALNALAAASGRDPVAIEKALKQKEAEAAAAAAKEAEEAALRDAAEKKAEAERKLLAKLAEEEKNQSQIYSALSPEEQYRFECFRRCGFPSKAVEKFVAKCLVSEAQRRYNSRRGIMIGLGGNGDGGVSSGVTDASLADGTNSAVTVTDSSSASDMDTSSSKNSKKRKKKSKKLLLQEESKRRRAAMDQPLPYIYGSNSISGGDSSVVARGNGFRSSGLGHTNEPPQLDNLVVPNAASEIVAVVSTLAKCYGQRLVAAARRVANSEEAMANLTGPSPGKKLEEEGHSKPPKVITPLLPHHFREAHRYRVQAGIDPGFWMAELPSRATSGGVIGSAALGSLNWNRTNYLAALAAQDAYDEQLEKMKEEEEVIQQNHGDHDGADCQQDGQQDKMDVELNNE